jgi:hypothetical protein
MVLPGAIVVVLAFGSQAQTFTDITSHTPTHKLCDISRPA